MELVVWGPENQKLGPTGHWGLKKGQIPSIISLMDVWCHGQVGPGPPRRRPTFCHFFANRTKTYAPYCTVGELNSRTPLIFVDQLSRSPDPT